MIRSWSAGYNSVWGLFQYCKILLIFFLSRSLNDWQRLLDQQVPKEFVPVQTSLGLSGAKRLQKFCWCKLITIYNVFNVILWRRRFSIVKYQLSWYWNRKLNKYLTSFYERKNTGDIFFLLIHILVMMIINGNFEISRLLSGNIRHYLTEPSALFSIEIHKCNLLRRIFREIIFLSQVIVIALSSINRDFCPSCYYIIISFFYI